MESMKTLNKIKKFREYLDYFERHCLNVKKAWELIKERCPKNDFRFLHDDYVYSQIDVDVDYHDASKLSPEEFTQYRQQFFPVEGEEKDKAAFSLAWKHHKENNIHHWQNWTARPATPYDDAFVVMMVIDWVAMGFEFGDTARDYYEKNKDSIDLPGWAIELMYRIFDCIYPAVSQ
jgi:hypothetical protein